jgi:phosphopantothenoylcysteine decarboxylase / phosphopantothenate---cysteine ligase
MNLLLYVTGSISSYKAYDLTRELSKKGFDVRVILSKGASKFIKKELFLFLGASDCYGPEDDFSHKQILHIELARWCDQMVICPASANTVSKLANGFANDFGTSTYLALDKSKPCLVFPAMNTKMLDHPGVQKNIKQLQSYNRTHVFPTKSGLLACNETGEGKLLDVDNILTLITSFPETTSKKMNILLSTGASINPLDDVRYITNPASGITGEEIARSLLKDGHFLTVIYGGTNKRLFNDFFGHPNLKLIKATTTKDFHIKTMKEFIGKDVFISSAALSDIEFSYSEGKIKKNNLNGSLKFNQSIDILLDVLKERKPHQKVIGFAAESDLDPSVIISKLNKKPVDFLVATKVDSGITKKIPSKGFLSTKAEYKLYEGETIYFQGELKKTKLAKIISERIATW